MKSLVELKQERAAKKAAMRALIQTAKAEKRELPTEKETNN